jgi:hypothetical protein
VGPVDAGQPFRGLRAGALVLGARGGPEAHRQAPWTRSALTRLIAIMRASLRSLRKRVGPRGKLWVSNEWRAASD